VGCHSNLVVRFPIDSLTLDELGKGLRAHIKVVSGSLFTLSRVRAIPCYV